MQLQDFDVDFRLAGTDLAELYDLIGVVLPETPPYELDGRLSRVGDTWRYRDFEGRVGDSDISGDVSVELGGERPRMRGELVSQRLDFDDLAGVMTSQALVFDTTDTAIVGAGKIDLRDEELDLKLRPLPKDESPIALRVPLDIGGTFKDPSFRPAAGPLAARTVAAALLYAVAPPAVILALLETGPGENVKCGEALAKSFPPAPAREDQGSPRS